MHYHMEIIMPPTDDVEAAVTEILKPFSEQREEEDEDHSGRGFWDWWVIGGRFAGRKFQATLDADKLDAFYKELTSRNVTVAGLTAGKQELAPASQIPMVDALWSEYFPQAAGKPCPLFNHSNDQYKNDSLIDGDVCRLSDAPSDFKDISRVIFASPNYKGEGLEATFMLAEDIWNGVNHEKTAWDGTLSDALTKFKSNRSGYTDEYLARVTPTDDWLVVTVDYHS